MSNILAKAMRGPKKKRKPCKPCKKGTAVRDKRGRCRCYEDEYRDDHSSKRAKQDRASRNRANAELNPPKGKEVHHKDGNPQNNSRGNIATVSRSYNRAEGNRRRRKKA